VRNPVLQSVVVVLLVHPRCMCEQLEISALHDRVTGVGWLLAFKEQLARAFEESKEIRKQKHIQEFL
jgi:GGDEF domain-containing protein